MRFAPPWCAVLAIVTGCNLVFPLDAPPVPDARECGTHDEDGDGVFDDCDNCPGLANSSQANNEERDNGARADEVGDACDPAPTQPGDVIVSFRTFAEPDAAVAWGPVNPEWSFDGESLQKTKTAARSNLFELSERFEPPLTVELRVVLDSDPDPAEPVTSLPPTVLTVGADGDIGRDGIDCGLARLDTGDFVIVRNSTLIPPQGMAAFLPSPLTKDVEYRLVLTYDGTIARCAAFADGQPAVEAMIELSQKPEQGALSLSAKGIGFHVEYFLVYRRL